MFFDLLFSWKIHKEIGEWNPEIGVIAEEIEGVRS